MVPQTPTPDTAGGRHFNASDLEAYGRASAVRALRNAADRADLMSDLFGRNGGDFLRLRADQIENGAAL